MCLKPQLAQRSQMRRLRPLQNAAAQPNPLVAGVLVALGIFVVANSAFIGAEGIGVGLVIRGAQSLRAAQQAGVDRALQALWDSPTAMVLGIARSLAWIVGICGGALALYSRARKPVPVALLVVAVVLWGAGGMHILPALPGPDLPWWSASLFAGVLASVVVVAEVGASVIPFGLPVLAAFLPQHGMPASAVGVACLGLGLVWRDLSATRLVTRPTRLAAPVGVPS